MVISNNERIFWVDNAKGIAILFVVLGHVSYLPDTIHKIIYSFHMPLFFILSGIFLDNGIIKTPFKTFLFKKLRTLMVPFFVFGIINVLYFYFINRFSLSGAKPFNIVDTIMDSLLFLRHSGKWFLCSLFFSQIILYCIYKWKLNTLLVASILFVGGGHFNNE